MHELVVDRIHSGNTGFSAQFPASVAAPLPDVPGSLDLTILVDRSSLEVFAKGGEVAMTMLFYQPEGVLTEEFFAPSGRIAVERWDLRSAWIAAPQ